MVYILFYRAGNENNAERFTGVWNISLTTVVVLLLLTLGLLAYWRFKKKTYHSRDNRYGVIQGNTKFQTSYIS